MTVPRRRLSNFPLDRFFPVKRVQNGDCPSGLLISAANSSIWSRLFSRFFAPLFLFLTAAILILSGCSGERCVSPDEKPLSVLTTVAPIADLVSQIGGDKIEVVTLVPAGREPETFAPKAAELGKLAGCRLFFRVGLACEEPLIPRLKTICPKLEIVDLREGLPTLAEEHHHDHESGEECSADGIDPHLWMSPLLADKMAERIERSLSAFDSPNGVYYQENRKRFSGRIAELRREIQERLADLPNRNIYVFHPAYGYFCREFDLEQRAIESGGRAPKPKELAELIRRLDDENVRTIIVQPEFSRSAAEAITNSLPIRIVLHSPLENDYFQNLRRLTVLIVGEKTPGGGEKTGDPLEKGAY